MVRNVSLPNIVSFVPKDFKKTPGNRLLSARDRNHPTVAFQAFETKSHRKIENDRLIQEKECFSGDDIPV